MKNREYKMLNTMTLKGMEGDIKKLVKNGWVPVGSIAIIKTLVGANYIQHMIWEH